MSQTIVDRQMDCATPPPFRLRAVTHSDQGLMNSGLVRREDPRWRDALAAPNAFQDEVFDSAPRRSYGPFAAACCGLLAVAGTCLLTSGRESPEGVPAHSEIQAALDMRDVHDTRSADVHVPKYSLLFELAPAWSALPVGPEPPRPETSSSSPPAPAREASQGAGPLELHPRSPPLPPRRPASLDAVASTPSPLRAASRFIDLAWATR